MTYPKPTTATTALNMLRVGIDDAPPIPMQMGKPEADNFRGYEVSLLEALAERLPCTFQYRRAVWSLLVNEVSTGKLDLVCSAATVTAERANRVTFCDTHLKLKLAAVIRNKSDINIDWMSARVGVRRQTTAEEFLESQAGRHLPTFRSEYNDELYKALAEGDIDIVVDDSPIALHFAKEIPGLRYGGPIEGTNGDYAIMLRKDNLELCEQINACLESMEFDGTLPALRKTWFNTENLLII